MFQPHLISQHFMFTFVKKKKLVNYSRRFVKFFSTLYKPPLFFSFCIHISCIQLFLYLAKNKLTRDVQNTTIAIWQQDNVEATLHLLSKPT
jgi:hypothetical protein